VKAINTDYKINEEILKMMRDNNCDFNKENIGSYIIFRDSLFYSSYYCTDEFVDFVKQNSITGLKFTCAGIAE
uniref:imm11 family protein n=1 Tax=Phocaeicola sp. TaxID=2773926 RepID=UPI003AF14D5E